MGVRPFHPLRKKGDFKKAFEQGSKFSSKNLVVYSRRNGLATTRIGLSVSKKIGNAVVRNRIRRRFREVLRLCLADKRLLYDFVLVARAAAADAEFDDIKKSVARCFAILNHEKNTDSVDQAV